ncbi:hypothetical protein HY772_09925 [Candidatus Woesearchaeota archaeon]|nr:hypothetical protein [Candidatus Woesearchaeota archaeon]
MIRIEINAPGSQERAPRRRNAFLNGATILRYLITDDEKLETAIICKQPDVEFTTTDQELYDALASVKPYDSFKLPKLVKLFEVSRVAGVMHKRVLTEEKLEALRKEALIPKSDENIRP